VPGEDVGGQVKGRGLLGQPVLRYETIYSWFIFFAAMDLMLTWVILYRGGQELNWVAESVIRAHGVHGLIPYKFALVVLIVIVCEEVGRRNVLTGQRLAWVSLGVTILPVLAALTQLLVLR
jgi:hypothetical protein